MIIIHQGCMFIKNVQQLRYQSPSQRKNKIGNKDNLNSETNVVYNQISDNTSNLNNNSD